ncbi:MAG: hypothetical protein JNK38_28315 [Acidobacteria bacterium]|nr:hypothetical protein [Acidobacteriota bacterium]
MSRRVIRTVDGQVFSDSKGRFQDRRGEILYRRGIFNTVRINRRSVTSDDVSGSSDALLVIVVVGLFIGLLLLALVIPASFSGSNGDIQRNPTTTDMASITKSSTDNKTIAAATPKPTVEVNKEATPETKVEVVVDAISGDYYLRGCSQLERVKQHNRRIFEEQQAISLGFKKHKRC